MEKRAMHSILYLFNALDELEEWACKKNAILLNFGESFYRNEDRKKNKQDEKPAG